jgi:SET domain-containing protein
MRVTPGKGSGSFVVSKISKGEMVASFGGNVIDQSELTNYLPDRVSRSLQLNSDTYLLSGNVPEPGDMINHSCEPNCGIAGTSSVQALRDLKIGEELTFDYAMSDSSQYDEFVCACGKEKCREKITGMDWQNKDLQTKYGKYFSSYIQGLVKLSHSK